MSSSTTDQVRDVVAPIVEARHLELYDVELAGAVLRVLVDRAGGVDLDTLSDVTRAVSTALDDADPMPGRYTLEVSSPGLERPLRTRRHFEAALGSRIRVKTVAGTEGERRVDGELVAVDDDGIAVGVEGETRRVAHESIERARTVFEWGPAPKPRSRKRKASKS